MNNASESWRRWRDTLFSQLDRVSASLHRVPASPQKVDLLEKMKARVDEARSSFAAKEYAEKEEEEEESASVDPKLKDFLLFLEAKKIRKS